MVSRILDWRGSSTGGTSTPNTYHQFARFRVADISRNHSSLIDAKLTHLIHYIGIKPNSEEVKAEYGIGADEISASREEVYGYKYVLDVDGNSFSGRFFGLLTSGSLVFKV